MKSNFDLNIDNNGENLTDKLQRHDTPNKVLYVSNINGEIFEDDEENANTEDKTIEQEELDQ